MNKTMDDLTSEEQLPEIQEHAIAAVQSDKEEKIAEAVVDGFDPSIHETGPGGKPVLTKGGGFRKKRGNKGGSRRAGNSQLNLQPESQQNKAGQSVEISSAAAAATTSAILERVQIGVMGDDMAYSESERKNNVKAWEDLYDYYGGVKVHPALAVASDHMMIILTRAQKPTFRQRLAGVKLYLSQKFTLGKQNALFNRGKNFKRQNDIREEESGEPEKTGH